MSLWLHTATCSVLPIRMSLVEGDTTTQLEGASLLGMPHHWHLVPKEHFMSSAHLHVLVPNVTSSHWVQV